jgi:3-oxoacyl-[acyl-carrier protein] reductase
MNEKYISIVTGASRGIGQAIAVKLAEQGHNLALFARDEKKLEDTIKECVKHGVDAIGFTGNVADPYFVNESVNQVLLKYGKVDNLINNAGVAVFKKFSEVTLEEFQLQMNTNMYGVFNFTKAVLDNMMERKGGNIINISSLAGKNSFVNGTTYSASKHALMGFSKSLMLEVRQFNIRVALVCPGSVNTELLSGTALEPDNPKNILNPSDVAETVASIINLPANALISEVDIRPTHPR